MTGGALLLLALLAYPLGIYFLIDNVGVLPLGVVLVALFLGRLWLVARPQKHLIAIVGIAAAGFILLLSLSQSESLLKLYPAFINIGCLVAFGVTLLKPPSMIERLARLVRMPVSPHGTAYMKNLTIIWCGFFLLNAGISAWLALESTVEAWALYTGIYSYIAMAVLFVGEYVFRGYYRYRVAGSSAPFRR